MMNIEASEINYEEINIKCPHRNIKFANELGRILYENIETFQKRIGSYPDLPVKIIIAKDNEEYANFTSKNKGIIQFSEAVYNFRNKTIYARNPKNLKNITRLHTILLHEYIHHFVHHHWKNAPLWFHEGMAVYFSEDLSYERELNFIKDFILGNSLPLKKMKFIYPDQMIKWESFYAKSALAIKYIDTKKKKEFYDLWDISEFDKNFDSAFLKSFYFTTNDFSNFFEEYAKTHFRGEMLLASSTIIWAFFPLIFLIGLIRRKIKNRRIEKNWVKIENNENSLKKDEITN